jgi:CheY-like chemotaxis protein
MADNEEIDVLVVDDYPDAAEAMALALEMDGYRAKVALSGLEALDMIERHRPHCVLLDYSMPGIDGLELTKRLRAKYGDDVVLVAITGYDTDNERVVDTFARVDHYFTKPVTPQQIRKLLPPVSGAAA